MARFVKAPSNNGDIVLVNTDHIEQVGFRAKQDKPTVYLFMPGKSLDMRVEAVFKSDEDAMDWIDKNFILFNK